VGVRASKDEETLSLLHNVPLTAPAVAQSNDIELTYDTFGDADAPPIVLIMGLAAQMIAWDDDFCIELAARGRSPRSVPR